jgi:glutathione S-transferase
MTFLQGRIESTFEIVDKHLGQNRFMIGEQLTIADISMAGYLFFPKEETGFDLPISHPNIGRWLSRLSEIKGWKPPYDLMPGKRTKALVWD